MKQAILITAYKDLNFISNILQYFDNDFDFFIHVDKKCKEDITFLQNDLRVNVYRKYRIEWGGSNHIFAILLLIQEAFKVRKYEYYHLITGSDLPIKPLSEFKAYFENHRTDNFIEHFPLPHSDWGAEGGMDRIKYYWLGYNTVDVRNGWWQIVRFTLRVQRKLKIQRKFVYFDGKLWGGSTYWSLSRNAISKIIEFISENSGFVQRFQFTSIGEEIFIQSILKSFNDVELVNNYLRYINWGKDQSTPIILTEENHDEIIRSNCFFARKFDKEKSIKLMKSLAAQK